jgi:single stranded DNA-binding protein
MASYNKVILMGNLTRDPELKTLPSQTVVCDFGLAVNRRWKDASGADRIGRKSCSSTAPPSARPARPSPGT